MKKIICIILASGIFGMSAFAEPAVANYGAKSMLLMEASTGQVLYEENADEQLPIASVTKIMTMLLIIEAIDSGSLALDDIVTASERAKSMGGSTMFLEAGEQLTVHDMLKGIAVASANDGCVAMAEHLCGSVEAFVEKMNSRAAALGMTNTNFVNTNGLDAEGHYSSARDVALMSRELLKHPLIFDYTTIWTDSLRDGAFELANTNRLIRFYPGANGLKTGSTSSAKCCISATALRDDMQLIAVVLGAPTSNDRFNAAKVLLDHGFASYAVSKQAAKDEIMGTVAVEGGMADSVEGKCAEDLSLLVERSLKGSVEKRVTLSELLTAPVKAGDVIGKVEILSEGTVVKEADIIASADVDKKPYFFIFKELAADFLFI